MDDKQKKLKLLVLKKLQKQKANEEYADVYKKSLNPKIPKHEESSKKGAK